MSFETSEIVEAYNKLRTYIYYDNSDILLRLKLVEFESGDTKDLWLSSIMGNHAPYDKEIEDFEETGELTTVQQKLEILTNALNNYHERPKFFDHLLNKIATNFYPKTLNEENDDDIITNQRIRDKYCLNRVTAFIDAPIELHIISVLWILNYGIKLDAELDDSCLGNRLLLNQNKDQVVIGSSLFKPYHKQYQKWRDDSVSTAQQILKKNKNALFINVDIRDYFHSVRIPKQTIYPDRKNKSAALTHKYNLRNIFFQIHLLYTQEVCNTYQFPYNFRDRIDLERKQEVILPIGLLSSYILANDYLKDFDQLIEREIKPAYYGRYVDDIMIVIAEPDFDPGKTDYFDDTKKDFEQYAKNLTDSEVSDEKAGIQFSDLTMLEKYIFKNLKPAFSIIPIPTFLQTDSNRKSNTRLLKIKNKEHLYCQSNKTFAYFFDHSESDIIIDKLKKDLNEKTSEFRDFPEEDQTVETFEESAYHLQYDNADAKVRTLKDYKEDRYGLTVYLSNNIFSALRHDPPLSSDEIDQVLKFFKGSNCLEFYRLWERIFTFFLVNKNANAYVRFYIHCIEQIAKIDDNVPGTKVPKRMIVKTLLEYLDCAHEIALSLNPTFMKKAKIAYRHFEFQLNKITADLPEFNFEPTTPSSRWLSRFRQTNMIRQHYVVHPLLSYTVAAKTTDFDLTSLKIDVGKYDLDQVLISNSPRPVKFWECNTATIFQHLKKFSEKTPEIKDGYVISSLFEAITEVKTTTDDWLFGNLETSEVKFYLNEAFELYKNINANHIAEYVLNDSALQSQFYSAGKRTLNFDHVQQVDVQEIRVNSDKPLDKPKISFANTKVDEDSIIGSIRGTPNLSRGRYQKLSKILRSARKENSDFLLFPEFFIPVNLLSSITRYSEKNEVLTTIGLEHINVNGVAFNFIVTIMPVDVSGIKDAVVVFRLKNHYAPVEEWLIDGNHALIPKPARYRYDIFIWKNIYFSTYYCFELANSMHRSLLKGKIDLLIGIEWNKDTNYYSNIVETTTRDLHVFMAQVNTSQYGDTRLSQPVETAKKDILRLKGGTNDAILVAELDIKSLREFQRKKFSLTHVSKEFKPLPPDFSLEDVKRRINNESVL